ncbi:hypothetical protein M2321_001244 [Rhodoblastus acidophilus]|nr:hypothetical protein [Rhodoblastus acidophilus]
MQGSIASKLGKRDASFLHLAVERAISNASPPVAAIKIW